jgi:tellurite resistance-related uncharacterized protein
MDVQIPAHATLKEISATYNQDTISRILLDGDVLPHDLWAQVIVADGEIELKVSKQKTVVTPASPAVIPPDAQFSFAGTGKPVRFHLNYFHVPVFSDGKSLASQMGRRVA